MTQPQSLKAKLRRSAISGGFFLFAIVVISLLTILISSYWQRRILNKAIEVYTEEEAKSLARLILYDLASDPRIKKMARYEEQITILAAKDFKTKTFYPLGLKAIIKKNLALPEGWLMSIAADNGYFVRSSDIQKIKKEILEDELKKERLALEDDLTARVTFSDHLRGIQLRSKWGLTEIDVFEEGIRRKHKPIDEFFKVKYPLFLETSHYGDVEISVDRGRLIHVQSKMKDTLAAIQAIVAVLLFLSMLVTVYVWFKFSKKVESEIVAPVTDLAERMEKWEREEKPQPSQEKNEAKRITSAFEELLERVKIQREQLLKAEKMGLMERLGAGLSHELNNALNPIKLRLDAILLEGGTASKDDISALKEHVESARKILKDLASIHPSRDSNEKTELKPSAWLSIAKRLAEPQIPKNVRTVWDFSEDEPAILGCEEMLTEIALNLILNSKDAVENFPKPEITVSFRENNGKAELTIEDNGAGFPAAYMEKLFEPFYTTKAQGMGLGLFIVETYVKRMSGEIRPENVKDGGAKVTVKFPLAGRG
jgi:signal transduction histidine kinase